MTSMKDCIFCKIVTKEIPADLIYEDEGAIAFLDINPSTLGHTLVIPKQHVENIFDTDPAALASVGEALRKVAPAVRDAMGAKGVHINSNHGEAAGQVVFHLHFHIIPRHNRSEFEFWPRTELEEDTAVIAEKIRAQLN